MKRLGREVAHFFQEQPFVVVSSIDRDGFPHNSCKGVIHINKSGRVYLLDLYRDNTFENLKRNPNVSITAVDEHRFIGYCLKGKARIVKEEKLGPHIIKAWDERIVNRLTRRVIKNVREEKGLARHPEVLLPEPEYMMAVDIKEVIDLTPHHLK